MHAKAAGHLTDKELNQQIHVHFQKLGIMLEAPQIGGPRHNSHLRPLIPFVSADGQLTEVVPVNFCGAIEKHLPEKNSYPPMNYKLNMKKHFKSAKLEPKHFRPSDFLSSEDYQEIVKSLCSDFFGPDIKAELARTTFFNEDLQQDLELSLALSFQGSVPDTRHFGPKAFSPSDCPK